MNLPADLQRRESSILNGDNFKSRYQVTKNSIERLGLETQLDGHRGCVNCLQWSMNGDLLASGSDDYKIMIWQPFSKKKLAKEFSTDHEGNIFSVKFMPYTNNNFLVSGAADKKIKLHDISQSKTVTTFANHLNRVKRLDVAQDCPSLIWSASEDGTVMETDIRAPPTETNVLVNLNSILGKQAEAKCVSINQRRPEWIAVGANDPYVRIYDRRKVKAQLIQFPEGANGHRRLYDRRIFLTQAKHSVSAPLEKCSRYFVAGHLPSRVKEFHKENRSLHATYVTFSPDGNDLLVNLGGEQIYLFNLLEEKKRLMESSVFQQFLNNNSSSIAKCDKARSTLDIFHGKNKPKEMPPEAERIRLQANSDFFKAKYSQSITNYNLAIEKYGYSIFYGNRAAAYMKRKWDGDIYAALRDCYHVLTVEPSDVKAHLRLCRCLLEMKSPHQAQKCLDLFKNCCPDQAQSSDCQVVEKEILEVLEKGSDKDNSSPQKEDQIDLNDSPATLRRHFLLRTQSDTSDSDDSSPEEMQEVTTQEENMANQMDLASENAASHSESDSGNKKYKNLEVSDSEKEELKCRAAAADYHLRFCGHCNTTTDIKEANFFGSEGQYIVAGSDDGNFFCWDRNTTNIVKVLRGDEQIVNCLQSHPSIGLLATSGIDPVVKLWSPLPEDGRVNDRVVTDLDNAMNENQRIMHTDPLEALLMGIGYRHRSGRRETDDAGNEGDSADETNPGSVQCRTS